MLLRVIITDNNPQLGGGVISLIITPSWGGNITGNNPQLGGG